MGAERNSVGIVIPVYRDVGVDLSDYIKRLQEAVRPETVIVEADKPSEELRKEVEDTGAEFESSETRRGKGKAITDGFESLDTDIMAFVDGDASISVPSFGELIDRADRDSVTVGSRRCEGSEIVKHESVLQKTMGDFYVGFTRLLLPLELTDFQCGAKAIGSEAWEEIKEDVKSEGFYWDTEILYLAYVNDIEITEVPVTWTDREGSTVSLVVTPLKFGIRTFLIGLRSFFSN